MGTRAHSWFGGRQVTGVSTYISQTLSLYQGTPRWAPFEHQPVSLVPSQAHLSFSHAVQACLWQPVGTVNGRSWLGWGRLLLHNSQSGTIPIRMLPVQPDGRSWAPLKLGLRSERWAEKTTIDYYIKQNEIVSPLEGRKVINSEGPVIRENDIALAVCFGLQFKRKNWKSIWCEVKGVRLTARGIGVCCFSARFLVSVFLSSGLWVLSHLLLHSFLPPSPKQAVWGRHWGEFNTFLLLKPWRFSVFKSTRVF